MYLKNKYFIDSLIAMDIKVQHSIVAKFQSNPWSVFQVSSIWKVDGYNFRSVYTHVSFFIVKR